MSRDYPPDHIWIHYRGLRHTGACGAARQAIHHFRPDVLYVVNTAWPGAPLACWLRITQGLPFLLDTGDVVAEMARSAGTRPFWQWPLLGVAEQAALRMASTVVVRGSRVGEAAQLLPELMLLDYAGEVDDRYPERLSKRIRCLWENPELLELRKTLPGLARRYCDYQRLRREFEDLVWQTHQQTLRPQQNQTAPTG